jgi:glycosyltransferase involved in cell wall biosynthesis
MITGTVIPLHNAASYINELFGSIICQSQKIDQIVFVDDCSQDNTINILNNLISQQKNQSTDILLIKNRKNMGISNAINLGISELTSDVLFYSGHDDIWRPNRIKLSVEILCNGANFVHSYFKTFGMYDSIVSPTASVTDIAIGMLSQNRVGAITVAINVKNIGKNNIYFNSRYNGAEDYDLWTDLITSGQKPHCIQEVLMDYRTTPHQLSRTFDYSISPIINNIQIKYFINLFSISMLSYYELIKSISQIPVDQLNSVKIDATTQEHLFNIIKVLEHISKTASPWKLDIYFDFIARIKSITQ